MATFKIKKGDTVKVIAGKDKNKEGKVIAVDPKNNKITIEGINTIKKHTKPSVANQNGGIITKDAPIDASNVMLVHKGKATRVGITVENKSGARVISRIAKVTGDVIDSVTITKKNSKVTD